MIECMKLSEWARNNGVSRQTAARSDTGTASGAGASTLLRRGSRANAQGEERFMGSPRCSSANCEDGTGSTPDKTATATRQRVAPKPVLVGGDR